MTYVSLLEWLGEQHYNLSSHLSKKLGKKYTKLSQSEATKSYILSAAMIKNSCEISMTF